MFELPLSSTATKIFFFAADHNGCGLLRMFYPAEELRNTRRWDVRVSPMISPEDEGSEIIIAQRSSKDHTVNGLLEIQDAGIQVVYELDDDLLHVEKTNPAYDYYKQSDTKKNIRVMLRSADLVTVSTPHLAEQVGQYSSNVLVLPNYLPRWAYEIPTIDHDVAEPWVGWAGGNSHGGDLAELPKALGQLDAPFISIGWDLGSAAGLTEAAHLRGSPDYGTYLKMLKFQVGVIPLVDSHFNRSKSHLKALEFGLRGIPVVAANVSPYKEYVTPDVGLLVNPHNADEWLDAINTLLHDPALRAEMGAAGRAKAEAHNLKDHIFEREAAYKILLKNKVPA